MFVVRYISVPSKNACGTIPTLNDFRDHTLQLVANSDRYLRRNSHTLCNPRSILEPPFIKSTSPRVTRNAGQLNSDSAIKTPSHQGVIKSTWHSHDSWLLWKGGIGEKSGAEVPDPYTVRGTVLEERLPSQSLPARMSIISEKG